MKGKFYFLLIIIVLALCLRLYGLGYGLPYIVSPDEKRQVLDALSMGARNSLLPLDYTYPALHKYFLIFGIGFYYLTGLLAGFFLSASDFVFRFLADPGGVFYAARLMSVILGVAIAIPAYFMGKKFFSENSGVISCVFVLFMFQLAVHSQWATSDILLSLFSACAFYYISRCALLGESKSFVLAGVFIGLSISTKYQGVYLIVPFLTMVVSGYKSFLEKGVAKKIFFSFIMIIVFSVLGNLGFIFKFRESALRLLELKDEIMGISSAQPFQHNIASVSLWFTAELLRQELVLGFILVLAILYSVYRRSRLDLIFLSYVLVSLLSLVNFGFRYLHLLVYILPVVCVFGAGFVETFIRGVLKERYKPVYGLIFSLIIIVPSLGDEIKAGMLRSHPDTRILAKDWIEENIPPGSHIAEDWYDFSVPLYSEYPFLFQDDKLHEYYNSYLSEGIKRDFRDLVGSKAKYSLTQVRFETKDPIWPDGMSDEVANRAKDIPLIKRLYCWFNFHDFDYLRDKGVSYIILSSYSYNHFLFDDDPRKKSGLFSPFMKEDTLANNKQAKEYKQDSRYGLLFYLSERARRFYMPLLDSTEGRTELVRIISPGKKNLGPYISIYRLNRN